MDKLKIAFLIVCKWLGFFNLSSFLYRNKLQILCYHGFSYQDEHLFRPSLFMKPSTLKRRLKWLKVKGFNVLELPEAIEKLRDGSLQPMSVVITVDDGFRSVGELAAPIFKDFNFPAMLYVTSYYAKKETPIFRLIMQYMIWKAGGNSNLVSPLLLDIPKELQIYSDQSKDSIWQLIDYGEKYLSEEQRVALSRKVAGCLNVDYEVIVNKGMMSLLKASEIVEVANMGVDIQLHTHRHTLPHGVGEIEREIQENRSFLEPLLGKSLNHFCYPSGLWSPSQLPVLERLNIITATTCETGLNDSSLSSLRLSRFLDREDIPQIEFEAELYGFKELLRSIRFRLTGE